MASLAAPHRSARAARALCADDDPMTRAVVVGDIPARADKARTGDA